MNATHPTPLRPAIYNLTGKILDDGWLVGELVSSPLDDGDRYSTGGTFSVCYKCSNTGKDAFLKVFDVYQALMSGDALSELARITTAFKHESFLLNICRQAGLSRVVEGLASVETKINEPLMGNTPIPFCYVIFEEADQGDLRQMLHRSADVDLAIKFKILHEVAVGLQQLHSRKIAHQDLKPSNVGMFKKEADGAKILDLGRATSNDHNGIYDHWACPGDQGYAPPDQLYQYDAGSFTERRAGGDLFQLGSLMSFLLFWQTATEQIISRVPAEFGPKAWHGKYVDVLPYLQEAFARWLDSIAEDIPKWCRKDVLEILRTSCDPDPHRRGDLRARQLTPSKIGPSIGLDRYLARLANLSKRAEVQIRLPGASAK